VNVIIDVTELNDEERVARLPSTLWRYAEFIPRKCGKSFGYEQNFPSDFLRKVGEPVSLPQENIVVGNDELAVLRDENCQENRLSSTTAAVSAAIKRCPKYPRSISSALALFTVRGVDTHLRNWPNAATIIRYACGLSGRGGAGART